MPNHLLKPKQVELVDFIQGLALLGISIISTQPHCWFGFLRLQPVLASHLNQAGSYAPTQFFSHLLVEGSFWGLFSFGFGWRFYQRWLAAQLLGQNADRIARRWLVALLGIGLIHQVVGWNGDRLHQYAILGFSLLYFSRQTASTLGNWITGLAAVGVLMLIIQRWLLPLPFLALSCRGQPMAAFLGQLVNPGEAGFFRQALRLQPASVLSLTFYLQAEMLLLSGLLVSKIRLLDRLPQQRLRLSLLVLVVFPLAILLKGVSSVGVTALPLLPACWQSYESLVFTLGDFLGTPLLTLVYLLEIGLNLKTSPNPVVVWISQLGRMSLSNYLLQSLLCTALFHDDGLGLSAQLTWLESAGVGLTIYAGQIWLSHQWLRRYRQGPLEQLLNRWTYRKAGARPSVPT